MYVRWDNEIYGYWKNVSIEAFQSLWIELQFTKQSNIIWGVIYRQHNAAKRFLDSFEEAVDHYSTTGKPICRLGDISINVLRAQTCDYAQQFLNCLPSYAFLAAIDMPTRVYNNLGGGGGVLPYERLMGMCRWMGSHFHNWSDYNGVAFLIQLQEWGHKSSDSWGK